MHSSTVAVLIYALIGFTTALHSVKGPFDGDEKVLKFNSEGKFRIVQFTDLHYGETPFTKDVQSAQLQKTILAAEQPDLVIMTGDCVSGYAWDGSQGWTAKQWEKLTEPMISLGYPWALALGNHDDQGDLSKREIVQLDKLHNLSFTQEGPFHLNGATNYYLPVYSSTQPNEPGTFLWMFDSNDNNCLGVPGWGCVYPDQVDWYTAASEEIKLKYKKVIPGLAFFHIPLPEFMNVWNYEPSYGRLEDEGVCCFSVNTGLYSAMKQTGNIQAVHCGHDHNNDYYGDYFGITLAYGRKSGHGGYGPPLGWKRGARVIEITENPFSIQYWIRQEDGSIVTQQELHSPGSNQTFLCCGASAATGPKGNCDRYEYEYREQHGLLHLANKHRDEL